MSDTATAYPCRAWEASPPAAVEVAFGLLTAQPSPLGLDGPLAQARLLPAPRSPLPCDAAPRAVLRRGHLIYPAGIPVLTGRPDVFGQPGELLVRAAADVVGCGSSAASMEATRLGEVAAVAALWTGSLR